jgi:hypothetical protein
MKILPIASDNILKKGRLGKRRLILLKHLIFPQYHTLNTYHHRGHTDRVPFMKDRSLHANRRDSHRCYHHVIAQIHHRPVDARNDWYHRDREGAVSQMPS